MLRVDFFFFYFTPGASKAWTRVGFKMGLGHSNPAFGNVYTRACYRAIVITALWLQGIQPSALRKVCSPYAFWFKALTLLQSSGLRIATVLAVLYGLISCAALNQEQCVADLKSGHLQSLTLDNRSLGLNSAGKPVEYFEGNTLSYLDCVAYCPRGGGREPFNWLIFTSQIAAWLLPWLSLVSQLPYGAEFKVDNLMSMILTVGSPTLAAYSLIITCLNGSYVASRFSDIIYPNSHQAARILAGLQQVLCGSLLRMVF